MSERKPLSRRGIGFFHLLAILFIGLKLTNYIDWAWVWVLFPLWAPWAFSLVIIFIFFGLGGNVRRLR